MGWKVLIAPSAQGDLRDIVGFIAFHDQDAAEKLGFRLVALSESLSQFPYKGRMIPEFSDEQLREILFKSYRILYRINPSKEKIEVVRFWHAARGFPAIPKG